MSGDVAIRHLASQADYAACVALQRETWGKDFNDTVPASILLVSQKLGGVAAGAFSTEGRLLGFVYGMTGVENGSVVHWSDMLAVRPEARDRGLGRQLKEFQRREVAKVGARVIYWTYDPLVARNAHLNFNVFGVRAVRYARDMYGSDTGSELHRGIGTDRIIVAWPVDDGDLAHRRSETAAARASSAYDSAPILGEAEQSAAPADAIGSAPRLRIAVPMDVAAMQARDMSSAVRWRQATRRAFETALDAGYTIDGFCTEPRLERGLYLLSRQPNSRPTATKGTR